MTSISKSRARRPIINHGAKAKTPSSVSISRNRPPNISHSVATKSHIFNTKSPSILFRDDDRSSLLSGNFPASAPSTSASSTSQQSRRLFTNFTKSAVFRQERNLSFRSKVDKAIQSRKIFSILGCFPALRRALLRRGWVEKKPNAGSIMPSNSFHVYGSPYIFSFRDRDFEAESDTAWFNRVLRDYAPDFIWTFRRDNINWGTLGPNQMVNRFTKSHFTSKVGIASCVQMLHWFTEAGVAHTNFPRCYRLSIEEEKIAFTADYRLTSCMNLLKWLIVCYERNGERGITDLNGTVPSICIEFAVNQLDHYVKIRSHEDIDWNDKSRQTKWDMWMTFVHQCNLLIYRGAKIAQDGLTCQRMHEMAKQALLRVAPFWPQLSIDGAGNIWICKPGALSRGNGIIIQNNLEDILNLTSSSISAHSNNWVIQKYIERPLLIYKTKFDIRQWFLVTDWSPLTVWFYKESYARFCSKPFTIDDFHESVHLCNNAVQNRYSNSQNRDRALPEQNMWDNYTFQAYLKTIGKEDLWEKEIYPGMKQGILAVLLCFQEHADFRKNSFELYGADFMLSDDFVPWLIEINSCPCLAATTKVTARMCAQVQEDCLKVTLDRRENRNATTGLFELMYKQAVSAMPMNPVGSSGADTVIHGKYIRRDIDGLSIRHSKMSTKKRYKQNRVGQTYSQIIPPNTEAPIAHLMQRIRLLEPKRQRTRSSVVTTASFT